MVIKTTSISLVIGATLLALASCAAQPAHADSTTYITSDVGGSTLTTGSDGSVTISSDVGGSTVTTVTRPDAGVSGDNDYDGTPNGVDRSPNCAICGN